MTTLPTLLSRTATNAVQNWTVEIDGDKYRTVYGQVGGKQTTTSWTVAKPTNEGRANERDAAAQALFEAKAMWKKKKESGYYENLEDIDKQAFIEPMLAKKYEDYKDDLKFPVFSQFKLDGIRCITPRYGMFTRTGKQHLACPHILEQLKGFFEKFPDAVCDGELYSNEFKEDFNKITSLVKKAKPTEADKAESARLIQYWVYDLVDTTKTFNERSDFLREQLEKVGGSIVVVDTKVAETPEQLDGFYEAYLAAGYEGQMVRTNGKYENKRSKSLLKRKEFQDAEYEILDVLEGEGNIAGCVGKLAFKTADGFDFTASLNGTREYTAEVWKNRKDYIGKMATVKFFNLTPPPRAVPRFPKVTCIRDFE